MGTTPSQPQSSAAPALYRDGKQPIDVRVKDLLSRMTLKEKVGQLNLPCVYVDQLGKSIPEKKAACVRFAAGTYTDEIGPGAGFFTLADTILHEGTRAGRILQRTSEDRNHQDPIEDPTAGG